MEISQWQATYPDFRLQLRCAPWKVLPSFYGLSHLSVNRHPVRASKHRAAAKKSERVVLGTGVINSNIPQHIFPDFLREIDVDPEEVG